MKIALLSPRGPLYRHKTGIFKKSLRYMPLTLPTLAALIPPELAHQVRLIDEGIEDIPMDLDADLWDRTLKVNLKSVFLASKCALPHLIARGGGSIINISSGSSLSGYLMVNAYAASKGGVNVLTKYIATQYGKHNVRVNCIAPGLIKTDFAKALWDNPDNLKASTARSPLLRIGIPDEIAGAAVFMGSAAGNFMTGQTVVIDGGATLS